MNKSRRAEHISGIVKSIERQFPEEFLTAANTRESLRGEKRAVLCTHVNLHSSLESERNKTSELWKMEQDEIPLHNILGPQ